MGCRVFLSLYWHSSTPLIIIIEAVCFYCCSFSFFFSNLITRWLGYLLKTEMMMIFFDAKKSKTRGYTASSILPSLSAISFLFFFIKRKSFNIFTESNDRLYRGFPFSSIRRGHWTTHTLVCGVHCATDAKKLFFFSFLFLSFVE